MNKTIAVSILGVEDKKTLINKFVDKGINWIHYDLMDGNFVENISLSTEEILSLISGIKKHIVDVHLMVRNPYEYIERLHYFADYISFHFEAVSQDELSKIIKDFKGKIKLGIALNPQTKVDEILSIIDQLDYVLIMSVIAGKGGQVFMPEVLEKVTEIKKIKPNILIQMDGGINDKNMHSVFRKGVDVAVSGSFLVKNVDNEKLFFDLLKE